ncbi:ubiquinone biosynthesis methyltransferase UbiE [Roseibium polysiphoniae]|uniref:Ubiquinone biosynthesis methyltransferase UbiE n=2 Tax=Roseibium polysiphoniae TaxID=2571221 RepID=A0ABR9C9Y5_9HYPH|nr:ubiquinone biosynthesis methyltransferase UbiE [Roseibium polysiphoniae]MBD8876690.1 ubiquinone biosynthesis methyltransferase UbiE [Roseibium polysiphoniae]
MTSSLKSVPSQRDFKQLLEIDMDVQQFGSDWAHCDQISSYASRMISHNRKDSLRFANLFSSAMNEIMETAFHARAEKGTLLCALHRCDEIDRIELTLPCDGSAASFFQSAIDLAHADNAEEAYMAELFSESAPDKNLGLLELAIDYNASISLKKLGNESVCLTVDLALEEPEN